MADVDEDHPQHAPSDGNDNAHIDLSDDVQDFRFLDIVKQDNPSIPKRGIKDFEPHGTAHQASLLAASRHAMHTVLSSTRIHLPKSHLIGYWHGPPQNRCEIRHPRGPHFKTMGRADREGRIWLVAEEMLYLLERGGLDVRWLTSDSRESTEAEVDEGKENSQDLPMSLQGAYAVCIGDERDGKIGMDRWCVYSSLKRSGYIVTRAPTWLGPQSEPSTPSQPPLITMPVRRGLFFRLYDALFASPSIESPPFGPLVAPGLYRSYNDIYRLLTMIPSHDPTLVPTTTLPVTPSTSSHITITFHVHKPTPSYAKSHPDPPDYLIAVLSARDTTLPTLSELSTLLATTPYAPPPGAHERGGRSASQRLKHGWRNVILAVVDQGIASYIRIADAAFSKERIGAASKGGAGIGQGQSKRGGRRDGGNRGRGRGRGHGRGGRGTRPG